MRLSPDTKRLMEAIDLLKQEKGITVYKIAQKIGYAPQSFSRIRAGGQNMPLRWMHKICDMYGINKAFVFGAEPPILLPESAIKDKKGKASHVVNPAYSQRLPLYDSSITAKMKPHLGDHLMDPNYFTSIPAFRDCTMAYRVTGESMAPRFRNGDIVVCKRVKDKKQLIYGEPYVIVTSELSTVKYIDPHRKKDSGKVVLRNENPKKYPSSSINKKELLGVFMVKGKVELS